MGGGSDDSDPVSTMREVRKCKPAIPEDYEDEKGLMLISDLLKKDPGLRLGALRGCEEFVAHEYFRDTTMKPDMFGKLLKCQVEAPHKLELPFTKYNGGIQCHAGSSSAT